VRAPADVPFGPGNKLLIHQVGGGDSLNRYEIIYHTSVRAIEGVNLPFRIPVPRDTILVIPLDTTEVGDLPLFEPVLVSMRNTAIQTMAFKVRADLLAFEEYNASTRAAGFHWLGGGSPREACAPRIVRIRGTLGADLTCITANLHSLRAAAFRATP